MRIAISSLVTSAHKSGVGNYIVRLIAALQSIDKENEYFLFIGQDTKHLFRIRNNNFHPVYLPFSHDPQWLMRPLYYLWQNTFIFRSLTRYRVDLLHLPNLCPLSVRYVPTVVTIPDLAEYSVSKYAGPRSLYRKALPHLVARTASQIITISENSKQDIIRVTGVRSNRVTVTSLAAGIPDVSSHYHTQKFLTGCGIGSEYILHVGGALPHKNLERVLLAYALLKDLYRIPHQLVLVGDKNGVAIENSIAALNPSYQHEVIWTGYVSDAELSALYQGASVFAFPSLYEGFGLPVLEAMSRGVPVVTSQGSSLPEVAGDAALLVDPTSIEMIAEAVYSLIKDSDLRESLIQRGRARAAEFSWDRCARETLQVYRDVIRHRPRTTMA